MTRQARRGASGCVHAHARVGSGMWFRLALAEAAAKVDGWALIVECVSTCGPSWGHDDMG